MKVWSLACAACFTVAMPIAGMAQSFVRAVDIAPYGFPPGAALETPLVQGPVIPILAPQEIMASVRAAGFDPLSRPIHRGSVYVVFAIDRYDADVRVTVDARSGHVLAAMRLAGDIYDEPRFDGYAGRPPGYGPYERGPYERGVPVPPADIPGRGYAPPRPYAVPPMPESDLWRLPREHGRAYEAPTREATRRNSNPSSTHQAQPRARSGEVVTGAARPVAPPAPSAPPTSQNAAPAAAPSPAQIQTQAAPPSASPPAMVPVAPLE